VSSNSVRFALHYAFIAADLQVPMNVEAVHHLLQHFIHELKGLGKVSLASFFSITLIDNALR
jgi:hypothetical protein